MKYLLLLFLAFAWTKVSPAQTVLQQLHRAAQWQESFPDSAIALSQELIASLNHKQRAERAYAYWNIAQANLYKHQYHKALLYSMKGNELFAEEDTSFIYQNILATTGWVYFDMGNYACALPFHEKALKTAQARGDLHSEVLYINALGLDALNSAHYPKALSFFRKGVLLLEQSSLDEKALLSTIQSNIGTIYSRYEDWEKAEEYLLKSIDNASDSPTALVETYAILAHVYLQTRQFDSCKEYLNRADSLSYHTNYSFSLMEYYQERSAYEQIVGNFQMAYQYQSKYLHLLNKTNNTDTQEVMNFLLDAQEEKIQQDKLIIAQAQKINANRRSLIGIIMLVALLSIGVVYYIFKSRAEKVLLRQQVLTQELKEKEKQQELLQHKLRNKDEIIESLAFTIAKRNDLVKELGSNISKDSSAEIRKAWYSFEQTLSLHQDSTQLSDELIQELKSRLQISFPELTDKDLSLIVDIRNKLSSKELADKYHVEVKSIEMSRYRLRKKLGVAKGESLRETIAKF